MQNNHLSDPEFKDSTFKNSPLEQIPKDWATHPLGSITRIRRGASPRPIDSPIWFSGNGPGWVRISDVTRSKDRLRETEQHLSPLGASKSVAVHPGQVIMSIAATIGEPIILDIEACIHDGFVVFDQYEQYLTADFLVHSLRFSQGYFRSQGQTGTQANLNTGIVKRHLINLPSLPEQHRIAEILDLVDAAIQQTDALIAKLKLMKAGLMHDLLTRGLDEQGHLRDPRTHPEQFKDSPLGRIPRGWEVALLGDVIFRGGGFIQTGPFGSQLHAHEYTQEGIPIIMPQDIQDSGISEQQIARIPLAKANILARHRVELNDVVFARRGDLSRCTAIRSSEVGWLCGTGCLLLRPRGAEIDSRWLAAMYRHDHSQRQILARAVGSTMVNLNTSLLATLIIAKPSYAEQMAMIEIMEAHDVRLHAEEAYYDKLKQLKKGLMHDLLTGRVRVQAVEAAQ
jgi:type I restriction enzyme S subunit